MVAATEAFRAERQRFYSSNGYRAREARRPALVVLGAMVVTVARFAGRRMPRWTQVRTAVLQVAGLGLLTLAAFQLATWAGFAAAGLSVLVLEALTGPSRT